MSTIHLKKPSQDVSLPFPSAAAVNTHHKEQEIDLLNLLDTLWSARKRILAVVFCFALVGLLAGFLLPQKWTSNAVVTPAEETQLVPLNTMLATLHVLGVDRNPTSSEIFELFIKKFESSVLLEKYIRSTPTLMQQFEGSDVNSVDLHRAIAKISAQMKAVNDASDKKENNSPFTSWTLSFTGPAADEAQSILAGYIKFISDDVTKQILGDIHDNMALKIQTESQRLALARAQLENAKETKIKRLNYSLQVAKAAGITKPVYSQGQVINDDPDFPVALGANGLTEKLEIERSINDVAELDTNVLNREYLLNQLKNIDIQKIQFPAVHFQQTPSIPVKKDGPGKGVIILLAALLGAMFACGGVLLRNAFASRRPMPLFEDKQHV